MVLTANKSHMGLSTLKGQMTLKQPRSTAQKFATTGLDGLRGIRTAIFTKVRKC
ncbi:hypothetical protein J2W35_006458 [Variovorax boronicumulans]|nr:hypothetical protein [Variovorax boronicumulans]